MLKLAYRTIRQTKSIFLGAILTVGIISSSHPVFAQDEMKISGSTGAVKTVLSPNRKSIEKNTGLKLMLAATGSSKGIRKLASGKIDLAILSASADKVIKKVNKKYSLNMNFADFEQEIVHQQELAIVINTSNTVDSISREQLHGIFTGTITNWKEVGGKNAPIVVITEAVGSGVRTLLENALLKKGEKFPDSARQTSNSVQSSSFIKNTETAISAASPINVGTNKSLQITGEGAINQRYYLVSKGPFKGKKLEVLKQIKMSTGYENNS